MGGWDYNLGQSLPAGFNLHLQGPLGSWEGWVLECHGGYGVRRNTRGQSGGISMTEDIREELIKLPGKIFGAPTVFQAVS